MSRRINVLGELDANRCRTSSSFRGCLVPPTLHSHFSINRAIIDKRVHGLPGPAGLKSVAGREATMLATAGRNCVFLKQQYANQLPPIRLPALSSFCAASACYRITNSPLFRVSTKRFNEQVRRNRKRFPADFMFQLTAEATSSLRSQSATLKASRDLHRRNLPYVEETNSLRSQIAALKTGRGRHRKYLPYVFTEHGTTYPFCHTRRVRSAMAETDRD
jgi:ORF6N domain